MSINSKSVLLSGLASGITIIISALAMVPVVGNEMDRALANRGLPPLSGPAMAFFGMVSLVTGIVLVWLYAVAKARLVPGIFFMQCIDGGIWFHADPAYGDWNGLGLGGIGIGRLYWILFISGKDIIRGRIWDGLSKGKKLRE
jgi:hypothetical protein